MSSLAIAQSNDVVSFIVKMGVVNIPGKCLKNGSFTPEYVDLIMENKQNNRKSVLIVDKIQFSPDVKDEFFTTRYLKKE